MTILLGGLIVEYSEHDVLTGELLDRYCVLNPDGCCSVSPPCLPNSIPTRLYWSPNPASLLQSNRISPSAHSEYYPLIQAVENCFGVGSFDSLFPMPITYDASTATFFGTLSFGRGPVTDPGNPAVWTYPNIFIQLEQTICDPADPEDPFAWFSSGTSGDTFVTYKCAAVEDISPVNPGIHTRRYPGNASLPYGNTLLFDTDGFQQYNPYNTYLEWNYPPDSPTPTALTASGTQVYYCEKFTSLGPGLEIPPVRDAICGINHPAQITAFLEYSSDGSTWSTVGTYVLSWRHGCYYADVVGGGVFSGGRILLSLHISVAQDVLSGGFVPHKMIVVTMTGTPASLCFTHANPAIMPFVWWNWLTVADCYPYMVTATQLFSDRGSTTERLRVTLTEV